MSAISSLDSTTQQQLAGLGFRARAVPAPSVVSPAEAIMPANVNVSVVPPDDWADLVA